MGRSDKKVKQDRINGLRKKYEAYLEDDKKRKERNEYILGKLDKMRSCATLVPQKYKSNHLEDIKYPIDYKHPTLIPESSGYGTCNQLRNLSLNIPTRSSSESLLLNEIINKYILIPKRPANYDTNAIRVNQHIDPVPTYDEKIDSTDWRSKYEILNELKMKEKGPVEDIGSSYAMDMKTALDKNTELHAATNSYLSSENTNLNRALDIVSNQPLNDPESEIVVIPSNEVFNSRQTNDANLAIKQNILEESEYGDQECTGTVGLTSASKKDEYSTDNYLNQTPISDFEDPKVDPHKPLRDITDHFDDIEHPLDVFTDKTFTPLENTVQESNINENSDGYEYDQSYFENSGVPNIEFGASETKHDSELTGIDPEPAMDSENVKDLGNPVVDMAGIETQSNEMFDQNPIAGLNEQVGDAYMQDENYQQNDQYYYEGQQQPYTVEINEHKETQEQYDQTYAQQYSDPNAYGQEYQQPEQYEQQPVHEQQLEYEQPQQQQEYVQPQQQQEYVQPQQQQEYEQPQQQEYVQPQQQQEYVQPQQQEYVQPQQQQEYIQPLQQQEYVQPQQQEYEQTQGYEQTQEVYEPVAYQQEYEQGFDQYGQQEVHNEHENYNKVQQELDNEEGISVAEYEGVAPLQAVESIETVVDKPIDQNK